MLSDKIRHRVKTSGWLDADRPRPIKLEWVLNPEDYDYQLVLSRAMNNGQTALNSRSTREVQRAGGVLKAAREMRRGIANAIMLTRVFRG